MRRKAGVGVDHGVDSYSIQGWELGRHRRYKAVVNSLYQWVLDLPAIPALLLLMVTVVRAKPTWDDLKQWRHPERARRREEEDEFAMLQQALREAEKEDAGTLAQTYPEDMTVDLAQANRRLMISKMLHPRLAADSWCGELP